MLVIAIFCFEHIVEIKLVLKTKMPKFVKNLINNEKDK